MGFRKTVTEGDATDIGTGSTSTETTEAAEATATPAPVTPEPIFARDAEGLDRPMSGGSFIRQEDGTLIRNPEA